jgi:murein DD-endopeptidase MepM/ murein hydrolase activator NlpD
MAAGNLNASVVGLCSPMSHLPAGCRFVCFAPLPSFTAPPFKPAAFCFQPRDSYVMWFFLRNIVAREQGNSTDMSRPVHLKRQIPLGVSASVVVLSGAMAVLGAPVASGAAAKTFRQAASADMKGFAVGRAMPGAQSLVLNTANATHAADALRIAGALVLSEDTSWPPFRRADLDVKTSFGLLSPGESVLVSMCRAGLSICDPQVSGMRPYGTNVHAWTGRVIVQAPRLGGQGAAGAAASGGTSSTAAPFALPFADTASYAGPIKVSLRDTLTAAGLPADLTAQLGRIFAGGLDVSTRAQAGDRYRVVYERARSGRSALKRGRISAVEITLAGRTYSAVWFVAPGRTDGDYFSFAGTRLVAQPFAMPLNYGRVSSPFGYRIHPVTGEHLFHTGVDLTAPIGTPVVAASPGTVQFVGSDSGYGKHVVVRHAGGYTSYYAHLSAFASGLRVGAKVSAGQLLGAVGQTGVATGPHLHFEVRRNNQPTDPLKLTSRFGAAPLAGRERAAFDRVASVARQQLASSPGATRTASVAPPARG